jgi:hypothetical protein
VAGLLGPHVRRPETHAQEEGTSTPRVVGLDLSLSATGIASNLGWVHTVASEPPPTPRDPRTGKPTPATLDQRRERLAAIAVEVISMCTSADLVVIEGPSYASSGSGTWDRAGLWWLVVHGLLAQQHTVALVPPSNRMKYATGKGRIAKEAVFAAVIRRYPDVEVSNNNEADAWVLAAMGARSLGHPVEQSLPLAHLEAMDKVTWPEQVSA